MSKLFLVFALAFAATAANGQVLDIYKTRNAEAALAKVLNVVDSICPGYQREFLNATKEMIMCSEEVEAEKLTMCDSMVSVSRRCFSPLVDFFEGCLDSKKKGIPIMIQNILKDTTDYLCQTDFKHFIELENPCLTDFHIKTKRCFSNLRNKYVNGNSKGLSVTKDNVCKLMEEGHSCLDVQINYSCPQRLTKESVQNVYNIIRRHCRSTVTMNDIEEIEMK